MTRGARAGKQLADAIIEMMNLMYNRKTTVRVLVILIRRLRERLEEVS